MIPSKPFINPTPDDLIENPPFAPAPTLQSVMLRLQRYLDHDPNCPEFSQSANRHNQGLVIDTAFDCSCGLTKLLMEIKELVGQSA